MRAIFLSGRALACGALALGACLLTAQTADHHFQSSLGFEFSYGKAWTGNLAGDFPLMTAADLDPQVRQNPAARLSACTQKIFVARRTPSASNLVVSAIPTNCTGQPLDLEAFKARTRAKLAAEYRATTFEEGQFQAGKQRFWILRTKGNNQRDGAPLKLEIVATVLERGLVSWRLEGYDEAAVSDFRQVALKLSDGSATPLEPGTLQLAASAAPAQPSAPGPVHSPSPDPNLAAIKAALSPDGKTPHHFESGLGFSYDVPEQLEMLNAKNFNAVLHFVENQRATSELEVRLAACSEGLLAAEGKAPPQMIVVVGHSTACLGTVLDVDKLPLIGAGRLSQISSRFALSGVQSAMTALGEHRVWAVRAAVLPRDPGNPMRHLAILLLPVEAGIVEVTLQAQTRAALDALMSTHIRFDDGAESQLFPAAVLRATAPLK